LDLQGRKGLYYQELDRSQSPYRTWEFVRDEKNRKTQASLTNRDTGEVVLVQIHGREGLIEAISRAEEHLVRAQRTIIKSHLKNG
jgi:DNA-directed RNA polymerase beta' subunit